MTRTINDIGMQLSPIWFDWFWNYQSNRTYALLEAAVRTKQVPRLSIFVGDSGTGKTASAKILGMVGACEKWDRVTHAPCGSCDPCRLINAEGRGVEKLPSYISIDGADRRSGDGLVNSIYEAYKFTQGHNKGSWYQGDREWKWIVFIDEAQRLKPFVREGLLTLIQEWSSAHVILATMDLRDLAIRDKRTPRNDPLIQRGTVYQFAYPTVDEASAGLIIIASKAGISITPEAAQWIAWTHNGIPRRCLSALQTLSTFSPTIDLTTVEKAFGAEDVQRFKNSRKLLMEIPCDGNVSEGHDPYAPTIA